LAAGSGGTVSAAGGNTLLIPQILVRSATVADQPALLELQRRASLANPGDRPLLLEHPDIIVLPVEHLTAETGCVAEVEGTAVGFAIVLPRDDRDADLDGLFVSPELWRHGIGRQLVETALQLAAAMGAETLHVVGNLHAESFYRSVGFVSGGLIKLQYGEGIAMWRSVR
jgi:GNAT superfamily N-acetyltransferase